ncbi:MAG: tRNA dihydrouridine synthase DusB [Bacteroidetes bacterium 4572_77]|nr:MAG: tRNA dihydrouridine synthase DusB [Bacteroidetes bacterium 4572_77]
MKIGDINLPEFPLALAPMEDITDPPFRAICKRMGADLMYSEFISAEGLIRDAQKSLEKLDMIEEERPVGIQLFGHNADSMAQATQIATQAKPDLIDINFGCPVKKVVSKFAGAGALQDVPLLLKITEAVVKATHLPVTVKTRLGWDENSKIIVDLAERLQDLGIKALTVHGRTRAQLYRGKSDWTLIGEIKNNARMHIPIIGNGDIDSGETALQAKNRYGVDAIMIGRASIGKPWVFKEIKQYLSGDTRAYEPSTKERAAICKEHIERSIVWKGEIRALNEMRKHYSNYFKGLSHFKDFKMKLMYAKTPDSLYQILKEIEEYYGE